MVGLTKQELDALISYHDHRRSDLRAMAREVHGVERKALIDTADRAKDRAKELRSIANNMKEEVSR